MKWEYKTITVGSGGFLGGKVDVEEFDGKLNRLGELGWELVSVMDTNQGHGATRLVVATFKRAPG